MTELHLLDAVAQDEQATISSLAAATRVTVSTMTTGVKRLEAKQYLERVRETADRRVVRVRLTERDGRWRMPISVSIAGWHGRSWTACPNRSSTR